MMKKAAALAFENEMAEKTSGNDKIAPILFDEYGVNLGLRDERGRGILTGLTSIS